MNPSNKTLITFLLLTVSVYSVSVCPSGSLSFDTFNLLAEDVLHWKSQQSDVFYRMTYQSSQYRLNCYKIPDQSSSANPVLSVQSFYTVGQSSWKIQSVSSRGSCVGVLSGNTFATFYTYNNTFTSIQTIDVSALSGDIQYNVNDNCTMIRLVVTATNGDITNKVYKNGAQSTSLALPHGTLFDYDFNYAIDGSSNFYKFENGAYTKQTVSTLKATPLYIKYSSALKAVITVTSDANGYSLNFIDPTSSSTNSFQKTLVSGTDYSGSLSYLVRSTLGTAVFWGTSGLVYYVDLNLQNSALVPYVYSLDKTAYSQLFNTNGYVSISNDIMFVYNSKKISYFQAYQLKLYYLGELASDIQSTETSYRSTYSPKEIQIVLSITSPSDLTTCDPTPTSSETGTDTQTLNSDQTKTPTVVDSSTGQVIKCASSCSSCSSAQVCKICKIGYSLNSDTGKCVFCNGCKTCNANSPSVCYNCFAPQVLNKTSYTCVLPACTDTNCLQCSLNGTCTKCISGYSYISGSCQKCTQLGCKSCSTSVDVCDSTSSCMLGYISYTNSVTNKTSCQPCATGCSACSSTDLSACVSCTPGYYPQADDKGVNRCIACFTNCKVCTSATQCTKCASGYVPSTDKTTCDLKCSDSCLTCDSSNPDTCLTCYAGSTLNSTSNKCVVDLTCNDNSSCKICSDGYVLDSGKCHQCTYTDTNCLSCDSSNLTYCTKCTTGFYLASGACSQCATNCSSCVGASACSKCNDGWYLVTDDNTDTGSCSACDSTCKTCSDTIKNLYQLL